MTDHLPEGWAIVFDQIDYEHTGPFELQKDGVKIAEGQQWPRHPSSYGLRMPPYDGVCRWSIHSVVAKEAEPIVEAIMQAFREGMEAKRKAEAAEFFARNAAEMKAKRKAERDAALLALGITPPKGDDNE